MTPAIASACQRITIATGRTQGAAWRASDCGRSAIRGFVIALPCDPHARTGKLRSLGVGNDLAGKWAKRGAYEGACCRLRADLELGEDELGETVRLLEVGVAA